MGGGGGNNHEAGGNKGNNPTTKGGVPFQRNQMAKIVEVLGMPTKDRWEGVTWMPEYSQLQSLPSSIRDINNNSNGQMTALGVPLGLERWWHNTLNASGYAAPQNHPGNLGLELLASMLEYDPLKRITAKQALDHPYFWKDGDNRKPQVDCFAMSDGIGLGMGTGMGMDMGVVDGKGQTMRITYPPRRVSKEPGDLRISQR